MTVRGHGRPTRRSIITPEKFSGSLNGPHELKVISRNNTNLVDPVGDSVTVNLIIPSFSKNIIVIDETDEFNNPFISWGLADSTVDKFYAQVFPGATEWDFKTKGMPPREVLADYKLIVWHADDVPTSRPHKISEPANIEIFTDYLKVGGKFLMSGWRILKSFAYYNNFPFTFTQGTFVHDYLHIRGVTETDILGDMTGAKGKTGVVHQHQGRLRPTGQLPVRRKTLAGEPDYDDGRIHRYSVFV